MRNLDYLPIDEAAALSGIDAVVLTRHCEVGSLRAVRRDSMWWIPRSEIITYPAPFRDTIFNEFIRANRLGLSLSVTLLVHGSLLSGRLVSIREFILECRGSMYQGAEEEPTNLGNTLDKAKTLIDETLKGPAGKDLSYDELFSDPADDPYFYNYCHLKGVSMRQGDQCVRLTDKVMHIRVEAIDGFWYEPLDLRISP